jgi:hypothetical protein
VPARPARTPAGFIHKDSCGDLKPSFGYTKSSLKNPKSIVINELFPKPGWFFEKHGAGPVETDVGTGLEFAAHSYAVSNKLQKPTRFAR